MEKKDLYKKVINDLMTTGDIETAVIASRDGLLVVGESAKETSLEQVVAMVATILGAAETATSELGKGLPNRIIVEAPQGKLVIMGAGPKTLVAVVAKPGAGLGLIILAVEKAAEKVKKLE